MTVLQLGPYPPPHGGVQTNLVAIRRYLRARGMRAPVINLTRHRREDADDVYYPKSSLSVAKLLLALPYDVLHLHVGGELTNRLVALGLACCAVPGKKTVLTLHSGGYPTSPAGQAATAGSLRGFMFRRFDRVIGVNAELVAFFHKLGVPESRTRLILPHSLSGVPDGTPLKPALADFFARRSPVLVTVGLLEPEYDLPLQIDTMEQVLRHLPNAGLVIIGAGSLEEALRRQIAAKPYRDHVLLCGDVEHAVTLRAIAGCDAFLRTTLYDGDSVSVREALHLGVPVIATDNRMRPPGPVLIPISDAQALCGAIVQVCAGGRSERHPVEAGDDNAEVVFHLYEELV